MAGKKGYSVLNALVYEFLNYLIQNHKPGLKFNPWVKRALEYCADDWIEFRTDMVMEKLAIQEKEIREEWEREEAEDFEWIYEEEEPDVVRNPVQKLLGGPISTRIEFKNEESPPNHGQDSNDS